jgi:hypothetical protein
VRRSAATLVEMFLADAPQPIAPNDGNEWTTPILERAIAWLVALGLTTTIKPRTLWEWYCKHTGEAAKPSVTPFNSQPL